MSNFVIFIGRLRALLSVFILKFSAYNLDVNGLIRKIFSWNVATFQCCYENVFWSVEVISLKPRLLDIQM